MTRSTVDIANRLIGWEAERHGVTRDRAREIVAREAGITPSALHRLQFNRLKFVDRIKGALDELLTRKIEQRIRELEHELAIHRVEIARFPDVDLVAAAAAVEEAKRLLGARWAFELGERGAPSQAKIADSLKERTK